jgi:L-ascorbate metabolism protein UlaG (beta-lactamase superfamily)
MTDGFFSRPSLAKVALGRIAPDPARIDAVLARAGVDRLAAVLPVHTHYDHAMDSAVVADRTGADLVGGESTAYVGRGHGLPDDRIRVVTPGEPVSYGGFTLTLVESHHCPPDRFPGEITSPVVPPVKAGAYKCGEAWSILVEHVSGATALLQGSAGFVEGSLAGRRADVAYLGVGQLGVQGEDYLRTYWAETVEAVGARRVVLTHWDDFFRPLDRDLRALPYAGDDLDVTMRVLDELATSSGVTVHFPTVWRREDPWR